LSCFTPPCGRPCQSESCGRGIGRRTSCRRCYRCRSTPVGSSGGRRSTGRTTGRAVPAAARVPSGRTGTARSASCRAGLRRDRT